MTPFEDLRRSRNSRDEAPGWARWNRFLNSAAGTRFEVQIPGSWLLANYFQSILNGLTLVNLQCEADQ